MVAAAAEASTATTLSAPPSAALMANEPVYEKTSAYGHFGRVSDLKSFTWERTDRIEALRAAF